MFDSVGVGQGCGAGHSGASGQGFGSGHDFSLQGSGAGHLGGGGHFLHNPALTLTLGHIHGGHSC